MRLHADAAVGQHAASERWLCRMFDTWKQPSGAASAPMRILLTASWRSSDLPLHCRPRRGGRFLGQRGRIHAVLRHRDAWHGQRGVSALPQGGVTTGCCMEQVAVSICAVTIEHAHAAASCGPSCCAEHVMYPLVVRDDSLCNPAGGQAPRDGDCAGARRRGAVRLHGGHREDDAGHRRRGLRLPDARRLIRRQTTADATWLQLCCIKCGHCLFVKPWVVPSVVLANCQQCNCSIHPFQAVHVIICYQCATARTLCSHNLVTQLRIATPCFPAVRRAADAAVAVHAA